MAVTIDEISAARAVYGIDPATGLPAPSSAVGSAFTEAGTLSITTGGTSQQAFAANTARKSVTFSNTSDTAMYVRFGAAAAAGVGIYCAANGGGFVLEGVSCPTGTVNVFCATTGKTFYAGTT